MVDIEFIKSIKNMSPEKKIAAGDFISREAVELLRSLNTYQINMCFAPVIKDGRYEVEIECKDCGKYYVSSLSKTAFLDYCATHRNKRRYYATPKSQCQECEEKQRIREENARKAREEYLATKKGQTEIFSRVYLRWGIGSERDYDAMMAVYNAADIDDIATEIQDMPYYDFLKTKMWKILAAHIKEKYGWACAVCMGDEKLATHHRSYDRHGYELKYQDDLICLCEECHSKFHGKK